MEENLEANENGHNRLPAGSAVNRWLAVAVVALIVAAGLAFGYGYRQQMLSGHMSAQASVANATINEMQGQLNILTAKLNEMSAAAACCGRGTSEDFICSSERDRDKGCRR